MVTLDVDVLRQQWEPRVDVERGVAVVLAERVPGIDEKRTLPRLRWREGMQVRGRTMQPGCGWPCPRTQSQTELRTLYLILSTHIDTSLGDVAGFDRVDQVVTEVPVCMRVRINVIEFRIGALTS